MPMALMLPIYLRNMDIVKEDKIMERTMIDKVMEQLDRKYKLGVLEIRPYKGCDCGVSLDVAVETNSGFIKVYAVVSYETVVGFIYPSEETLYEYGKYTSTTSCQITKIMRDWYKGYERVLVKGVDTASRFDKKPVGYRRG